MRGTLTALRKKYGGKIRLVYRHLPLTEIHPLAWAAAEASECAAEQGKFWPYHDLVFENARRLTSNMLAELGERAGVRNIGKFKTCVRKGRYKSRVRQDVAAAQTLGMNGTPAFFIGWDVGNGMMEGQLLSGAQSLAAFVEMVDDALAADRKNGGASNTRRFR